MSYFYTKFGINFFRKMKALFTTILLLISFLTFSQNAYQIADTTKKWNTVHYGAWAWLVMHCGGTKTNKLEGVTLVNDTVYLSVFETQDSLQQYWDQIGFLREDTLSKKIYFTLDWNGYEDGLIYDFDLLVGDSVIIDNYYVGFEDLLLICDSIDSLFIDGSNKKRLFLSKRWSSYVSDIWIEGIGSKYGLLNSGLGGSGMAGSSADLLCCSKNDTVIYMDSVHNSCYIEEFYPKIVSEYYDTAYLNTYYEFQLIISDTNNIDSVELIGAVIPEGFEFDASSGMLTGTPTSTGSFVCIIQAKNCDLGFLTDMLYSDLVVELETTIQNKSQQGDINIYPNPFRSNFYITSTTKNENVYYLEMYNGFGELNYQKTINKIPCKIDCTHYNDGIYFLKITDANQKIIKTKKLIKK